MARERVAEGIAQGDDDRERLCPHSPLGWAANLLCGPIERLEGHRDAAV